MTGCSRIEQITIIQENAFKQKKENWDKNSTLGQHYLVFELDPIVIRAQTILNSKYLLLSFGETALTFCLPRNTSCLSLGAFHLSEMTGQTIFIIARISFLIKTIQPDQSNPTQYAGRRWVFQKKKTSWKSLFHGQNDWSCHGPAGQFGLLESALCQLTLSSPKSDEHQFSPHKCQYISKSKGYEI